MCSSDLQIFEKWDLHAVRIGSVTDDGLVRVRHRGAVVAELPIPALTDEAPVYRRPMERPAYLDDVAAFDLDARAAAQPLPAPADALRQRIESELGWSTAVARHGQTVDLQ